MNVQRRSGWSLLRGLRGLRGCSWLWIGMTLGVCGIARAGDAIPPPATAPDAVPDAAPRDNAATLAQADAIKQEQYAIANQLNQEYPHDFEALRILGFVHSSHGNLEAMSQCWQECRQLAPHRADVYDQLARYAADLEHHEDAIGYWRQALQLQADLPGAWQGIGSALQSTGQLDEAIEAFRQEIRVAPDKDQAHFLLAEALFQRQEFAEAKACYQRAVQLQPLNPRAYYGLMKVCARLGQPDEAAKYAAQFRRLDAGVDEADQTLRRRFNDLQQMRERLAITCTDAGQVYLSRQQPERAERLWRRAAEVDPKNATARARLAPLYAKQQKVNEADAAVPGTGAAGTEQRSPLPATRFSASPPGQSGRRGRCPQANGRRGSPTGRQAIAHWPSSTSIPGQQAATARQLAATAVQLEPVADSYFVLGWAQAQTGQLPEARSRPSKSRAARTAERNVPPTPRRHPKETTLMRLDQCISGAPSSLRGRAIQAALDPPPGTCCCWLWFVPAHVPGRGTEHAIQLRDVTAETGIHFRHTDGSSGRYYMIEYVSAGLALFDYDLDGDVDIYFLNGAPHPGTQVADPPRNALYRNDGGWKFTDVTEQAGVGDTGHGLGVTVGDYDGDGDPDLYLNNLGPNVLYRNNGDGTFTDVTRQAGVQNGDRVGAGTCFLDIDADGDLDLYVANYIKFSYEQRVSRTTKGYPVYPGPRDYPPDTHTLLRNNGDGTFRDVSVESGIAAQAGAGHGHGLRRLRRRRRHRHFCRQRCVRQLPVSQRRPGPLRRRRTAQRFRLRGPGQRAGNHGRGVR